MKFVKESYDKYDNKAKESLSKFLIDRGFSIKSSQEDYQHDLICTKEGVEYCIEVEVKVGYPFTDRDSFKFDSVSFLGRKERLHKLKPFIYVIICNETNWAVAVNSTEIFKEKYRQIKTINTPQRVGEDVFFRVPKDRCKFFKL